jgi:hypothetical protein
MMTDELDKGGSRFSLSHRVATTFIAGLLCGNFAKGFWDGFHETPSGKASCTNLSAQSKKHTFGRAEYERLNTEVGMPLATVEAILGSGTETSKTSQVATYIWEQADCSTITGIFENGRLKSKQQKGLK